MKKQVEVWEVWSNLAYNIAGFLAYYFQGDLLFCFALQALGAGSFIYHRDKTSDRKNNTIWLFDWWAMTFCISILFGSYWNERIVWYSVIAYQFIYTFFMMGKFNVYAETSIIAIPAAISLFLNRSLETSLIVLAVFLFGVWVRSRDVDTKQLTFHDSKHHAAWHLITAVGFYLALYL